MSGPNYMIASLDDALKNYTAGIDHAVRFVTIDQVDMLAEFYLHNRRTPDPRDEVIARLVEENNWQIKARAQHWLRRTISAPEDAAVEEICEKYGYGAVMDAASRLWARKPYGSGAFYVGGCIGFKSDDEARAALAAAKAVQHG